MRKTMERLAAYMRYSGDDFSKEKKTIEQFAAFYGATVEWRNLMAPQYQLAKIWTADYCIIAYPHQTSAHNYHIRLRDQGSKDVAKFREAVGTLYHMGGNNCTFSIKDIQSHINTSLLCPLPTLARKQRKAQAVSA